MSSSSKYWNASWPCIVGCKKDSDSCRNCWALGMMQRMCAPGQPFAYPYDAADVITRQGEWSGKHFLIQRWLDKPLHWRKPRTIAVNWLGDMWREEVPVEWISCAWSVMMEARQHTYLLLTKRIERMVKLHLDWLDRDWKMPDQIWSGLTVCNQDEATKILHLLRIPGKRWLSVEPILSAVDLAGDPEKRSQLFDIDWIVVGAETGPGARPCDPEWVRSIVEQCTDAGVPVWVKQAPPPEPTTEHVARLVKHGEFWPREKPEGMP